MSDQSSKISSADLRRAAGEIVERVWAIATYALDPILTREDVIEHVNEIHDLTADFLEAKGAPHTTGRQHTVAQTSGDRDADLIGTH